MKRFFSVCMLAVALTVCCGAANAQNNDRQRLTREQLAEKQARHIAEALALDTSVTEWFIETFCRCQQEIWALGPRAGKGAPRNAATETEAQTEQELKARFERSRKILDIRQKYYEEYSEKLRPKQIKRVYELERQMMHRLSKHPDNGNRNGISRPGK